MDLESLLDSVDSVDSEKIEKVDKIDKIDKEEAKEKIKSRIVKSNKINNCHGIEIQNLDYLFQIIQKLVENTNCNWKGSSLLLLLKSVSLLSLDHEIYSSTICNLKSCANSILKSFHDQEWNANYRTSFIDWLFNTVPLDAFWIHKVIRMYGSQQDISGQLKCYIAQSYFSKAMIHSEYSEIKLLDSMKNEKYFDDFDTPHLLECIDMLELCLCDEAFNLDVSFNYYVILT